jgi:hypothetical protein
MRYAHAADRKVKEASEQYLTLYEGCPCLDATLDVISQQKCRIKIVHLSQIIYRGFCTFFVRD